MHCETQDQLTGGNGYAKYNETTKQCVFTDGWYEDRCKVVGGYWEEGTCYRAK